MLYLALLVLLTGCATAPKKTDRIRQLFFRICSVDKSNASTVDYEIYFEDSDTDGADDVVGYVTKNGKVIDVCFDGYLESESFFLAFMKIGFTPFDYRKEILAVDSGITEQRKKALGTFLSDAGTKSITGPEYEITICVPGPGNLTMVFRDAIPLRRIAAYALHSERFKKLKEVMDLVAQQYGNAKIGI